MTPIEAKHALTNAFSATPYRPTGLARSDQALANLVETLEWCTILVTRHGPGGDRSAAVAESTETCWRRPATCSAMSPPSLPGADIRPPLDRLEQLQDASAARMAAIGKNRSCTERDVHISFHARIVAGCLRGDRARSPSLLKAVPTPIVPASSPPVATAAGRRPA